MYLAHCLKWCSHYVGCLGSSKILSLHKELLWVCEELQAHSTFKCLLLNFVFMISIDLFMYLHSTESYSFSIII